MARKNTKLPVIGLNPFVVADTKNFTGDAGFKDLVMSQTIRSIKKAIKEKKKTAILLQINNEEDLFLELPKVQWDKAINSVIGYYEVKEDFEKCIELKELLKTIG